ncbi:ABC transporter permease [Rhodococcus sp. IEGM 1408]|uniref:ABC transporter permease n=1 Tax=Rhodococcus sp. IEGM 1408 TaxID=3082220 RepID=UPI00295596CC|nr:ABC transporter permease [Rhodococcus sp. IEGM 1408]MDV8001318.1 ABC transporter permease [Rhodococcus sp. IEGM 1408]
MAVALAAVPLLGMAVRIPWADVPGLLASEAAREAGLLSLRTCAVSTLLCVLLGTPLALLLSRSHGPLAALARTVTALPMVLPPVVAGLALLITLGRTGVLGRQLSVLGIEVGFTTAAVVIAQTFVAMPFLVVALEGALRSVDARLERTAASLGASPTRVLATVTLPLVLPALVAGATMSFARALGEFGATLTFAGSLQGTTRTLPLEIYLSRETDTETALALALLLIGVAALLMAASAWVARRVVVGRG